MKKLSRSDLIVLYKSCYYSGDLGISNTIMQTLKISGH